jgi:hypothetical protein
MSKDDERHAPKHRRGNAVPEPVRSEPNQSLLFVKAQCRRGYTAAPSHFRNRQDVSHKSQIPTQKPKAKERP